MDVAMMGLGVNYHHDEGLIRAVVIACLQSNKPDKLICLPEPVEGRNGRPVAIVGNPLPVLSLIA